MTVAVPEPKHAPIRVGGRLERPIGEALALLATLAAAKGWPVTEDEGVTVASSPLGQVRLFALDGGVEIEVVAPDRNGIVTHMDLAEQLAEADTLKWLRVSGGPPARLTLARVVSCTQISPNFRRLRIAGDFSRFAGGGLHFRLVFGPEGADWPTETAEGLDWPGGIEAWHRPTYTIRAMDPAGTWLDTDIFLHDGGRVTAWTGTVRPGDEIGLTGPGGGGLAKGDWVGLIGDETALPVVIRMIEALPETAQGRAAIFVPHADDAQPVKTPAGVVLDWVTPDRGLSPLGYLQQMETPAEGRFVFFAAERKQSASAREWLTAQGFGRGEFRSAAYWTAGAEE